MSYIKALKDIQLYQVNLKTLAKTPGLTVEKFLAYSLNHPYKGFDFMTLKPGEIFSRPFVREFTDAAGNKWLSTTSYSTGITAYAKLPGSNSYELTGDTLTSSEHNKINKERDEGFLRQALKQGKNIILIVLAAAAAYFIFLKK